MSKGSIGQARKAARRVFEAAYFGTKDYRAACRTAGVSERTGRRWRAELDAAGPRGLATHRPHARTSFVGRTAELSDIRRRFAAGVRLISIIGPPGIGKTRLATQGMAAFAAEVGSVEPPVFCDLRHAESVNDFTTQISESLDVRFTEGGAATEEAVGQVLRARSICVLVLDNFEGLVSDCSGLLMRWVDQAPDLRVLVTSRRMLRVQGEELVELGPISLPDVVGEAPADAWWESEGMTLFWERASAIEPSLRRSELQTEEVAHLVRHLEGVPLAIELAAAQMRRSTPGELLMELRGRTLSLANPLRDADRRHATLSTAIDQSWRLLSEAERFLLARLSVFRQGFSTEAALAIAGHASPGGSAIVEALTSLREASLLRAATGPDGERRWDLYEAVREFAADALAQTAAEEEAQRWAADYYLRWGEKHVAGLVTKDAHGARRRLTVDLENLRQSFAWFSGSGQSEGILRMALVLHAAHADWLPRVAVDYASQALELGSVRRELEPLRAELLLMRAATGRTTGDYAQAVGDLDHAERSLGVPFSDRQRRDRLIARTSYERGMLALYRGRAGEAREWLTNALDQVQPTGEVRLEGYIRSGLAWVLAEGFRDPSAFIHHPRAVALMREAGDPFGESMARRVWAMHRQFFEHGDPGDEFQEAVESVAPLLGQHQEAWAVSARSSYHLDRGRYDLALSDARRARSMACRIGLGRLAGVAAGQLSHALDELGQGDAAVVAGEEALAVFMSSVDLRFEAIARAQLAGLYARQGRIDHANALLDRASALLENTGDARLPELIDLQRAQVDLACSRRLLEEGEAGRGLSRRRHAVERMIAARTSRRSGSGPMRPLARCSIEARHFLRLLERQLEQDQAAWGLVIGRGGGWFRLGRGRSVPLAEGGVLRRVLTDLVVKRLEDPGQPATLYRLLECGWPGERMRRDAGVQRVRDTVKRLRRAGLGGVLLTADGGYLLTPELSVEIAPTPESTGIERSE